MAGSSKQDSGGGCAILIVVVLVIAGVLFLLSTIGHALGLTPTFSELTDRPDGWVDRPDYIGRVEVVGTDHYGLDSGGEPGGGCESG